MRKFLVVFLFALLVFGLYRDKIIAFLARYYPSVAQIEVTPLSEDDVIGRINIYRTENKLMGVNRNEKLDKAALARLTVIMGKGDFSGEVTGLSTENAAKNNGYNYSVIGDLYAENIDGKTDLIGLWTGDEAGKKTLLEARFRDIGVAISREENSFRVIVILARTATLSPVQKTGAGGYPVVSWGGPELWEAINKRRVELGVNPLSKRDELCTVAAIRLNQLLELGRLDGHAGFEPLLNREDLKYLREKYTISEFLIVGYPTPLAAVSAWENTLGHRALLAGGEYVWGCVYAQNTFGVAIAAY